VRKQTIFARRLRGDLGPLDTDPVRRLMSRIIAPAVSITGYDQDYEEATDIAHYNIGSRMVVDDRVFHYGRAGNTLDCGLGAHIGFTQDVAFAVVTVDADAAGKYTLEVTVGAGDGRLGTGEIPANELSGGYIIIFPDGMADTINRRIVSHTGVAAPGGAITVTVDRPLPVALTPNPHAELIASPYLDVLEGLLDRRMIVGMPPIAATVGQYLWLQTWGPVWITPTGVDFLTAENSLAMFRANGTITEFIWNNPATGQPQIAGTVMTPAAGGGQGAPFVNLMLAP